MPHDILLIALITLPFVGSCLAALLPSNARNAEAWLAGAVTFTGLALVAAAYPGIANGASIRTTVEWLPELGLDLTLRMDGFAWLLAVLITGIGFLVVLYARYYMSPADPVPRFFSFLLAFMGAMLGIVLSGNLIQLVFFWELTSLFSFLLIGYWHQNASARDGARMALIVTSAGGLCLFGGVLLIGHIVGSYDLDHVLAQGRLIRSHELYRPALILVLLGALTKSAQFPFHFWLPHAMAAPTPVSAYLHSATMVKAGVFLLVRLWPALGGTDEWLWLVGSAGLITFIFGAYVAIFQQDLKGLLAYSTISHLGLITLLIGLDSPHAPGRRDLPHHEPRHLQGVAVHGRRDHRPRKRHARYPAPQRALALHADHREPGHGCRRRNGRRAVAERVPVQGDVLRRDDRDSRQFAGRSSAALRRHGGQHVHRRLFAALHPRRVLRPASDGPAAHAARAAVPDAPPGRDSRSDLPRHRHDPRPVGRSGPPCGDTLRARRRDARLQPGRLAWLYLPASDERRSARRRGDPLFPAARLSAQQCRGAAAPASCQGQADFRTGAFRSVAGLRDGSRTFSERGVSSRNCG